MKANELRIGNYLYYIDDGGWKEPVSVTQIDCDSFYAQGDAIHPPAFNIDCYEPIPLTEEILIKCGFEETKHIHGYSFYTLPLKVRRKKNIPTIDIYSHKTVLNGYIVKHVYSLHELQNLFFVTTGQELEINLSL